MSTSALRVIMDRGWIELADAILCTGAGNEQGACCWACALFIGYNSGSSVGVLIMVSSADDDEEKKEPTVIGPLLSPVIKGWRGLAHYRTWSRRKALEKDLDERSSSDLYLLEEIITDVKFICDLPLALRLNICKVLGYEKHDAGHRVCKQGDKGTLFYIIFTGSVKASVHELGVQDDRTWTVPAGKWFGDGVLETYNYIQAATVVTNEKTELLTLTRRDYERVLDIKKTPELRERVSFLKGIPQFQTVSRQSLLRLANVLSNRTYSKNRVITFQGDDAVEMFFIKSGECRVVLQVHSNKLYTPLPRASSFLKQYWPTSHHRCKMEPGDREKDWWHPSLEKRKSVKPTTSHTPRSSRCTSIHTNRLPTHLGSALLRSPDMIQQLVRRKKSRSPSLAAKVNSGCSAFCTHQAKRKRTSYRRRTSAPMLPEARRKSSIAGAAAKAAAKETRKSARFALPRGSILTRTSILADDGTSAWGSPKGSIEAMARSGTLDQRRHSQSPPFPVEQKGVKSWPFVGGAPVTNRPASRYSLMQIHFSDCYGMKRSKNKKYSLRLFLRDCERKEKADKKAEFQEKEHRLWQMGVVGDKVMPGVVGEDNQCKFQKWARPILDREKKVLSYNIIADSQSDPSFMPGIATSAVMELQQGPLLRGKDGKLVRPKGDKDATILDIGSLRAGQYFGERGLITNTRRAASIVAVSLVETLVLTKWDFHRHCDSNIINVLSENDYQKERRIFKNYLKTRKWERYKRKVVDEVMQAKRLRIRLRVGPRAVRVLPKKNGTKFDLPKKEWLY